MYIFIDRKAREMIRLVASVYLSGFVRATLCTTLWVQACIVHHCVALCTMVHKGDLCPWEVGVTHNIFHFLMGHMEHAKSFCPYLVGHKNIQRTLYCAPYMGHVCYFEVKVKGQGQCPRSRSNVWCIVVNIWAWLAECSKGTMTHGNTVQDLCMFVSNHLWLFCLHLWLLCYSTMETKLTQYRFMPCFRWGFSGVNPSSVD